MDQRFVAAGSLAALVTLFTIFSLRRLAPRLGLVDRPSERKRHRGRVPLIGGLSFFLGTLVGIAYYGPLDGFSSSLLAAGALIFLAGLIDDIQQVGVTTRLLVQAGAAGLVIAASGVHVDPLGTLGGVDIRLYAFGIPLTVIAVVGLTNAFNMLDGIDGLAGCMALVSIVFIVASAGAGWPGAGVALVLQVLAIALVPYLLVNLGWPDGRKIFMGDAGSTFIGFLVAWTLVYFSQVEAARLRPTDVLWCVAVPVMDTSAVMARRIRRHCSPFMSDRRHLHHRLVDAGVSTREALLLIVGIAVLFGIVGFALRTVPSWVSLGTFLLLLVAYAWWQPRALQRLGREQDEPPAAVGAEMVAAVERATFPALAPGLPAPAPSALPDSGAGRSTDGTIAIASIRARPPGARVRTLCVLGTSPEDIALGPIVQQLARDERFDSRICTAMSDPGTARMLQLSGIRPDLELDIDCIAASGEVASAVLSRMKQVLQRFHPDVVLVHGHAPSALAMAMAARYERVPVAHMAACAPFEWNAGWPGPATNDMIGALALLHIAPTRAAGRRLVGTGVPEDHVAVFDGAADAALRIAVEVVERDEHIGTEMRRRFHFLRPARPMLLMLNQQRDAEPPVMLGRTLRTLASERPDLDVVCVTAPTEAHLLPRAVAPPPNLHRVDACDFDLLAFAYLLRAARLVVTNSFDVRTRAAVLETPSVLVRSTARRGTDGDEARWIASTAREITDCVTALLVDRNACGAIGPPPESGRDDGAGQAYIFEALANLPQRAASLAA